MAARKSPKRAGSSKPRGNSREGRFESATTQSVESLVLALESLYPDADCELDHDNPLQLLIATILSAQSTDKKVNEVCKPLFSKYTSAADFANADPEVFEQEIRSTGFYRHKTKNVLATNAKLVADHGGEVPQSMSDLLELPGVARKTANVVLGTAFGQASGVVVDTHVKRLSYRLGLSSESDPIKIERGLMSALPQDKWVFLGHAIILHGRRVCHAKRPDCASCALADLCPRNGLIEDTE